MQLFASDFLNAEFVLKNLGLFLIVVAVGMPTLFTVRLVALAAGICGVIFASIIVWEPTILFWSAIFSIVNLIYIMLGRTRKFGRALTRDEQLFHREAVPMLTDSQTRMLLSAAHWMKLGAGDVLTQQGETSSNLYFVAAGTVNILVDGKKVAECGPGDLVGEIGVSTGQPAMATSVCATAVRCLEFESERLYKLLDGRTELLVAVETAVQSSLRGKLQRANERALRR
jgi:CRP-like cAMP-binding protein